MGLVPVEKTFPRGGQPAAPRDPATKRQHHTKTPNLFGGKKPVQKQKKEHPKNRDGTKKKVDSFYRLRKYIGRLTYKSVSEGMLVLGSISRIEKFQLIVNLPGNLQGYVPITNISEPYSTALSASVDTGPCHLRDLFKVGQHVITRVISKVDTTVSSRVKITLSAMPQSVYSDLSKSDVVKGTVLTAAVKSMEEKGFIMDLGIKNTTAFLKHCNTETFVKVWNDGKPLVIGQLVRCVVKKATQADTGTIVLLSANPKLVAEATCNNTGATLETLVPGMQFDVTVSVLFSTGIQVRLSDNFVGYVQQDHFSKPFKTPENFEIGTILKAKVLYILESGVVYFTLKSDIFESKPRTLPFDDVHIGETVEKAVVISVNEGGYVVRVGKSGTEPLKGFIPLSQTTLKPSTEEDEFDVPVTQHLASAHPVGSEVKCRVTDYIYMDEYYTCTMDEAVMNEKYIHASMLKLGLVIQCFIKDIKANGITLSVGKNSRVTGFVLLIHVSDVPLSHPEKKFNIGQPCTAKVLNLIDGNVMFTMKPTLVQSKEDILSSYEEAERWKRYSGTVLNVTGKGLLVGFYNNVTGWVPPNALPASSAEAIIKNFYVGQVVRCTVTWKYDDTRRLTLSMKDSAVPEEVKNKESNEANGVAESKKKEKLKKKNMEIEAVNGVGESKKKEKLLKKSKNEESKGVSIPSESKKKDKLSKKNKETLEEDLQVPTESDGVTTAGQERRDRRNAVKLKHMQAAAEAEAERKKAKKALKAQKALLNGSVPDTTEPKSGKNRKADKMDIVDAEPSNGNHSSMNGAKSNTKLNNKAKKLKQMSQPEAETTSTATNVSETSGKRKKSDSLSIAESASKKTAVSNGISETVELPRLSVSTGFVWDATPDLLPVVAQAKEDSESSDDEPEETGKKVKKTRQAIIAEKRAKAQEEEARLRSIEQRLMDVEQPPQSADEFDRLVLSSPDSSMVWLQYMAHHLQATEIEKARNVAQRALKSISFREEQERLNVWVALLNLENLYGTKESLELTLEEAVRVNDAYQVYTQMLQIYGDSHKLQEGDKLIGVMIKKYKNNKDTWFNAATFYMKSSQMEKARALLQRALSNLDKKEHVPVISRFAQLENKLGSMERAQTLMEQILTTYPKRVDVWSAYVDMLVKSNLIQMARQVLERAVVQKLPSHKMKTLFKKFLAFEEAHGSEDGANKVRQMALEYVESAVGADMQ